MDGPLDTLSRPGKRTSEIPTVRSDVVKIWDLPTRLFHWALVLSCTGAVTTGLIGGNWMDWHLPLGIATLGLLAFRLVWGIFGPRYARFSSFPVSLSALLRYVRNFRFAERHAGHSPTGAIAVLVLLLLLILQSVTGLFSSNSIDTEGPLVHLASERLVSLASLVHVSLPWVLYVMVGLHVAAVLVYLVFKKENLIGPMVTGNKRGVQARAAADSIAVRIAGALLICALIGLGLYWLR